MMLHGLVLTMRYAKADPSSRCCRVQAEFKLVCLALNLRPMGNLRQA